MNELQVVITKKAGAVGIAGTITQNVPITQRLDDLRWTTVAPGGFGSCSLFLPGDPVAVMTETGVEYLADIKIMGAGGGEVGAFAGQSDILFEGRVEDIRPVVQSGRVGIELECIGYQSLTNEPYRNAPIRSDTPQRVTQQPITDVSIRPEYARLTSGAGQSLDQNLASRVDTRGMVFRIAPSVVSSLPPAQNMALEPFPFPGTRVKFDRYAFSNPGGGSVGFRMYAFGSYLASFSNLIDANADNNSPSAYSIALPSGFRSMVRWDFNSPTGNAMATWAWLLIDRPRILAPRGPSALDDEPVYGHELVQDVIFNSLLTKDYTQVDSDTSYQFTTADFSGPGQTLRGALDYITAFYSKFWAVWENQTLAWKSTVLTTVPDWIVSARQGVTYNLEPSVSEAARSVRVSYADVRGVTREITYDDPRFDNIMAIAGATKQAQVAIPVVTNASAAQQIATTYFPDHSYEVLRGTIVIPAQALLSSNKSGIAYGYGSGGGRLPAYKIRAGESIRLTDNAQPRDYFSTQYDRKTTLFIRSTSVDWEAQTITLEVDNTRDSLSTLLARVALQTQSKFPGT